MATFEKGDMFHMWGRTDLLLVTTNSTVTSAGNLVMGRGAAKQLKETFPQIARILGEDVESKIWHHAANGEKTHYGLIVVPESVFLCGQNVGIFQVKYHYSHKALLALIEYSTTLLFQWIVKHRADFSANYPRVDINYPGIGNGGLTKKEVEPIIKLLPDCVHIWEYEKQQQMNIMDIYDHA